MRGWEEKAACAGKHELFEITDRGSGFRADIEEIEKRDRVIKSHNRNKFAVAQAICKECPVRQECGESATTEDLVWTVRAGILPPAFRSYSRKRPVKDAKVIPIPERICRRGHVGFYRRRSNGDYRCMKCRAELERPTAKPRKKPNYLPGTCARGHVNKMVQRKNRTHGTGYQYCGECNRLNRQKSREREKAAKMKA